ncbi:hypothetical protein L2E82_47224 [Cichorium intybus]|uniref:Uncharacterized protein n=1 Tax=Cichorium intybus TaxID=13427 RepID=A0ACB8YUZ0_CICIN|nr:hypothetical protein L2E82_47224 [Cichorium intybus]
MSFTITAITGVVLPPILSSSSYSKVPTHTVAAILWVRVSLQASTSGLGKIGNSGVPTSPTLLMETINIKNKKHISFLLGGDIVFDIEQKEGKLSATWPWVTTMSISVQQPSMVLLLEPHLFVGNLLKGQTVGVIGAGRIGTACQMQAHHPWTRFFKKPTWRIIHKVKIWKAPMFDITKLMEGLAEVVLCLCYSLSSGNHFGLSQVLELFKMFSELIYDFIIDILVNYELPERGRGS